MVSEEYRDKIREMFEPCLKREDLSGKIELVSLEWLLEMANPAPSDSIDMGVERPGVAVSMSELGKDIKKRGLREPLVIAVGLLTGRARLEAGNHRVRLLLEMGFLHAPVVCWVGASHVGFEGNGTHEGRLVKFWPQAKPLVSLGQYDERYFEKPSDLLPSVPVLMMGEAKGSQRATRTSSKADESTGTQRKGRSARTTKAQEPKGSSENVDVPKSE